MGAAARACYSILIFRAASVGSILCSDYLSDRHAELLHGYLSRSWESNLLSFAELLLNGVWLRYKYAHCNADRNTLCDSNSYPNRHTDQYSYTYTNTYSDSHTNSHSNGNPNTYPDAYSNRHANKYSNINPNWHSNSHPDK
jgi:hypothetical protein